MTNIISKILIIIISLFFFLQCIPAVVKNKPEKSIDENVKDNFEKEREVPLKVLKKSPAKKSAFKLSSYLDTLSSNDLVKIGLLEKKSGYLVKLHGKFKLSSNGKEIFDFKTYSGNFEISFNGSNVGMLSLATKQRTIVKEELVLTPLSENERFEVLKYQSGSKWVKQEKTNRSYKGELIVKLLKKRSYLVNRIPVEEYVKGVIPAEMHPSAPLEALKAQAVIARTNVYSTLGNKYKSKPYDLTSNVYSQVYGGAGREQDRSNQAVELTKGIILTYNNEPIEAVFHATSGGFIEANENVWSGKPKPYLRAKPDFPYTYKEYQNLSNQKVFKNFIDSYPPAYCNMKIRKFPAGFNYAKKYFRWQKTISRSKLERHLRRNSGVDVGHIKNIYVLKRGRSGKALKVRVVGTKRNLTIAKELNIRKKLYTSLLYSANFYVSHGAKDKNGLYKSFTFNGAGFGHGCGLSQISAVGMALDGFNYQQILDFFYLGTKIKKM